MSGIAVYAGSFDPITNGHVDLVRRSLQVFERVIVAVAFNANKDSAWFTPAERVAMIADTFRPEGGRVVADWPGLKNLHENRDLKPTTDLRAVLKGLLKDHLRIEDKALAGDIFPDSAAAKPMAGLLA